MRLDIRDRDFPLGDVNALNIVDAIGASRKTVLLVSRHFIKNKWCKFEMNIAIMEGIKTNRQVCIIVYLEDIPLRFLPKEISKLLQDAIVLDFPKENPCSQNVFWACLANSISE
ncbi:hypothetical protein DPMN_163416 [Dreissena polymorpha]|uniref:TIR domain-containing protein n=1 Tax=Dreissena polymorpha TaxID=45954 RepID=A0A9D4IUE7_DREPO|nr:hypothetical protein DPMN_163416 [Dreissena polymorpha]